MADKTIGELPNLPAISPLDLLVAQHNEEATKITGATLTNFFKDYIGPVAATSASQMTNTNKVYIYIGNESGYTNGNWYYYNGSTWVSGGAYNSQAVNTDATLTHEGVAADAEAAGKIVEISETQPAAPANRVWIPETQEATVQVPTWAEHEELADDISDLNGAITSVEKGLAIIVTGDTCTTAVPSGGYAYIKNNTHGLTEGLYRNKSASAFPTSGGIANSTVFEAVPNGGLNAVKSSISSMAIEYIEFGIANGKTANIVTSYGGRLNGILMSTPSGDAWMGQWMFTLVNTGNSRVKTVAAPNAGGITVTNDGAIIKVANATGYDIPFALWGANILGLVTITTV